MYKLLLLQLKNNARCKFKLFNNFSQTVSCHTVTIVVEFSLLLGLLLWVWYEIVENTASN